MNPTLTKVKALVESRGNLVWLALRGEPRGVKSKQSYHQTKYHNDTRRQIR
jgi:hypothetical protein